MIDISTSHAKKTLSAGPLVGAYYFPNYHVDPRNEVWHGRGWTEWELVKRAEPRWHGHQQPRVPLLGYEDEADPAVMNEKIALATMHGVNAFLFDWYWYGDRPYLQRALEDGFMPVAGAGGIRFALMWANHDWTNIHPMKRGTSQIIQEHGGLDADQFRAATDYMIERYFKHPSYLVIEGRPMLQIYDLPTLVHGLGSIEAARIALDDFRQRVADAGLGDIHLNAIVKDVTVLPQESAGFDGPGLVAALGFDSVTSYVWVHHVELPELETSYSVVADQAADGWEVLSSRYAVPYYPNVTVGWDSSPRTVQSDIFDPAQGYPHTNTIADATPSEFGKALERARAFAQRSDSPLVTINAWNEWTEGTYLEPDTVHRYGHLEEILRVFGGDSSKFTTAQSPGTPA
ncbi:glycoside hydrolase family 99-like domain-containing protein [Arthrobacter sp. M4]|uniref:glycosyltransferase WbsX family protein n=1 Tax=Arthrobacter sp. M4 TaxID=218160 RepID=UPI001CDBFFB5|nr:glycoside hydrolase family 99-like domain-containing protein [Arthrobacter sp. M4]MCA4132604.1 glycoside hydrolase family 99-like domain-containing protein [Arthrobacter sp. M4]